MSMAGGDKPKRGSKKTARFQGGAKSGGGSNAVGQAGPGRASKTPAKGARGSRSTRRERA
jgi:hypothetical protein